MNLSSIKLIIAKNNEYCDEILLIAYFLFIFIDHVVYFQQTRGVDPMLL